MQASEKKKKIAPSFMRSIAGCTTKAEAESQRPERDVGGLTSSRGRHSKVEDDEIRISRRDVKDDLVAGTHLGVEVRMRRRLREKAKESSPGRAT